MGYDDGQLVEFFFLHDKIFWQWQTFKRPLGRITRWRKQVCGNLTIRHVLKPFYSFWLKIYTLLKKNQIQRFWSQHVVPSTSLYSLCTLLQYKHWLYPGSICSLWWIGRRCSEVDSTREGPVPNPHPPGFGSTIETAQSPSSSRIHSRRTTTTQETRHLTSQQDGCVYAMKMSLTEST